MAIYSRSTGDSSSQHLRVPFHGGLILSLSCLTMFLSGPAQTYGVSAFIDPIIAEFGWSRSLVSTLYSLATLVGGIPLVLVGRQIDRVGSRIVLTIAAVCFGMSLLWLSWVGTPLALLLGFMVLRSCGSGILTMAARTLVPHWFIRRRGRAFSLIGVASALSLAAIPRVNEVLIDSFGWRDAWRILGVVMLLGLVPILALLVRSYPEDVGEFPDGAPPLEGVTAQSLIENDRNEWTLSEAKRTRAFWALLVAGFVPSVVLTGVSFHQSSMLLARGMPSSLTATIFACESAIALPVTLLAGWLVDRYETRYIVAASQAFLLIALSVLMMADSTPTAMIYGALRGASTGLFAVSFDYGWVTYFGKRNLGSIRGVTFAVGTIGAAIGPIPLGFVFDSTGSYGSAVIAYMLLPAVAAVFAFTSVRPRKADDEIGMSTVPT